MKQNIRITVAVLMTAFLLLAGGCQKAGQNNKQELQQAAQPVVDDMITAFNTRDYARFSNHLAGRAQELGTEENFNTAIEQLGSCTSIEYVTASDMNGLMRVAYKARFSRIPDRISFTVVFSRSNAELLVSDVLPN